MKKRRSIVNFTALVLATVFLTACTPNGGETNASTNTNTSTKTNTSANTTTTTPFAETTTKPSSAIAGTTAPTSVPIPKKMTLSLFSRKETDAVEIVDMGNAGKHCMLTDPEQIDTLFAMLDKTEVEYTGKTVKGIYGIPFVVYLYKQGEVVDRFCMGYGKNYSVFTTNRYSEWDTEHGIRYYESMFSLDEKRAEEFRDWFRQFPYEDGDFS